MSAFSESERLRAVFSHEARGSFSLVYRALVACASEAKSSTLQERAVIEKIRAIRSQPDTSKGTV